MPEPPTPKYAPVIVLLIGVLAMVAAFALFIQLAALPLILVAAHLVYGAAGLAAGALWPGRPGWWPALLVAPPLVVVAGLAWEGSLVSQDVLALLAAAAGAVLGSFGGARLRRPVPPTPGLPGP